MRIAYLTFNWPRTTNSGVGQKMLTQMQAWRAFGHEVGYVMHTHPYPRPEELLSGIHVFYRDKPGVAGKIWREFSRAAAMAHAVKAVEKLRPQLIYLRSGRYVYPLHRLFDLAPVIMEINGNESAQERLTGLPMYLYHRLTAPMLFRRSRGFVTISHQLAKQPERACYGKPTLVMGNSFDVAGTVPFAAPSNPIPRLVFIGSPGNPWHGVDKLVQLAQICSDLVVDVIGYDRIPGVTVLPANLILHGYLPKADYIRVLAQADAAIASVGLHRAGLVENSLLKTRECLAYGLPMVLPYHDIDLENLQVDWLLPVPNEENNLSENAQLIRDFAYQMRGRRVDRAVIMDRLDSGRKEAQRVDFFKQVSGVRA